MQNRQKKDMGQTCQKHLILLHTLIRLGDGASKNMALDYIEENNLYRFRPGDHDPKPNCPNGELTWRSNFAYRRKDLEREAASTVQRWIDGRSPMKGADSTTNRRNRP